MNSVYVQEKEMIIIRDKNAVDNKKIYVETSKLLIDSIKLARKCKYLKQLDLSASFDSYFDESDKFDFSRLDEFVKEFREKVPISSYEDYLELINLIYFKAEPNVLLPGLPKFFALSSGTMQGKAKIIPVSSCSDWKGMKDFPSDYVVNAVQRAGFSQFNKNSKGIHLITRYILNYSPANNIVVCSLSSIISFMRNDIEPEFAKNETDYKTRILTSLVYCAGEPDLEFISGVFLTTVVDFFTLFEQEFLTIVEHIEKGTLPYSHNQIQSGLFYGSKKLAEIALKPNKKRADELRKLILNKEDITSINLKNKINLIWPKFSLIYSVSSGSFEPYLNICKTFCPNVFYLNTIYGSTEGFHAVGIAAGSNHYVIGPPSNSFIEFIPQDQIGPAKFSIASELEVDKIYETVITSPITGLIRYALGDLVRMVGWLDSKPVISILGRKDACIRDPNYIINESEFISCMNQLIYKDMQYLFFLDIYNQPTTKIGVFIEYSSKMNEIKKEDVSRSIHTELMKINQNYSLVNFGSESSEIPINVYFVETNAFLGWTLLRVANSGMKSTNQIKLPRVALSDEAIQYFFSKVK